MNRSFLILAMASGETSQAYAIASYLTQQGKKISLAIKDELTMSFFNHEKLSFPLYHTPTVASFKQLTLKLDPDTVIFCNSKSFKRDGQFVKRRPPQFKDRKVITIDSNWLFNENSKRYPFIEWADDYFVNIPSGIFSKGLIQNKGYFSIKKAVLSKIKPIGFIPSYQPLSNEMIRSIKMKYKIESKKKVIFCYFSGFGAVGRPWVLLNLIKAIIQLKLQDKVVVIAVGNNALLDPGLSMKYPWLIQSEIASLKDFYELLASSDLVFQHQGLATLAQAISARIPTIANVRIYPKNEFSRLHPEEIRPFYRSGVCQMLYKSTPTQKIANIVNSLLYDQDKIKRMIEAQKKYYQNGEEALLSRLIKENA